MSRIQEAFQGKKAFIPFITCGDPDLETTEQLVYAMEKEGAAIIELGIPFSDPTAEGPVIQAAIIPETQIRRVVTIAAAMPVLQLRAMLLIRT